MATPSPPPQSSPPVPSPPSSTSPPPPSASTPPTNANPPLSQSQSPPPDVSNAPPPLTLSPPVPPASPPPPPVIPPISPPPSSTSPTPPEPSPSPSSPPPRPSTPPLSPPPSAPRPSPPPTHNSSPPPPTHNSSPPPPTPSTQPPPASPPPPPSPPPINSPPPSQPPFSTPPPPSPPAVPPNSLPPASPPPSPPAVPPNSLPPPSQTPPTEPPNSPPPSSISPAPTSPSRLTPPSSQPSPSPPNSTSSSPPPPSISRLSPPPPPPPPQVSTSPPTVNASGPSVPESSESDSTNGGIGVGGTVAIGVAVGIIMLGLVGLSVWWCLRKQRKKSHTRLNGGYVMPSPLGSSPRSDSSYTKTQSSAPLIGSSAGTGSDFVHSPRVMAEPGGLGNSKSLFSYEELTEATNGFSNQNLLGEGGFGAVYKGCLPDGREVAVKQLKIGGGQGEREFKAEIAIISRIHHRHLVSLVGYCISDNRRLLVYDYVPNNNLYFHLHGERMPVLDWAKRVKIAAGAARGIAYLHEDCNPRIVHRDIKSSNILLDNNFEARVSDFGLAKLALDANTHVTTRVMGTFGYMAPEYASSGKLTEKSDVFSFGVVLLELITGRKPVDASQPLGDESLVEWARPLLSHALDSEEFKGLADPKLGGDYVESEMFRMIEAATACVRHSAAKRPRMGQVVRAFESLATSDLTNGMKVVKITVQIILAKMATPGVVEEEYDKHILTRAGAGPEPEQRGAAWGGNLNRYSGWTFGFQPENIQNCRFLELDDTMTMWNRRQF
ncbi:hypothetical protein V6N11_074067 [Hibiscus sabdariffa]|uniref:non-specific serine/threonine protein kinase n=1 Tax=Hibiscus sabdariffa TaxID=183260 RepID=A0ABR1ZCN8_9ROSI